MSSNRISETITSSDITQRLFLLMILGSRCSVQDEKKAHRWKKRKPTDGTQKKAHRWSQKKKKKKGPPMAKRKAQRWPNIKFLIK